jgi:hypothetical protein
VKVIVDPSIRDVFALQQQIVPREPNRGAGTLDTVRKTPPRRETGVGGPTPDFARLGRAQSGQPAAEPLVP